MEIYYKIESQRKVLNRMGYIWLRVCLLDGTIIQEEKE
jgi:hypothetical protein